MKDQKEPIVSITLQWYRKKNPGICVDCGALALNSVMIQKDFRSTGSKTYCDECKVGFVEKYAKRGKNPRKVKPNKPIKPEVIKGVYITPPKYTKPEAIEFHKKYKKLMKEVCFITHSIAMHGLYRGSRSKEDTKSFLCEARNHTEKMAREYEHKARLIEFGENCTPGTCQN